MHSHHLGPRLLWVAALAALFALPSQAQNRQRTDDSEPRRYERDFDVDRRNERTFRLDQTVTARGGERFHVEGDVRVAVHVRGRDDGETRITGQINGNDVTVTRMRDRQVFRVTGTEQFNKTFRRTGRDQLTASTVVDFNLITQGQEPNYRLFLNLEGDVNREGELNARVTDLRVEERGGGGAGGDGRYDRDFQVDRDNERTYSLDRTVVARGGERFGVEGDLRVAASVRREGDDRLRVSALADAGDLTVTRLDNRQVFDVVGSEQVEETLREPERDSASFSTVVNYRLVPTGRESVKTDPDVRLFLTIEGEVGRDGNLMLRIAGMEIR